MGDTIIPPKGLKASLLVFSASEIVSVELNRAPKNVFNQEFHEITSCATKPRECVLPRLVLGSAKVVGAVVKTYLESMFY